MKIKFSYYQAGQSLVETVVALGVIVLVISAMVSLGIVSLRATSSAKFAAIAKNLADEELELLRVYRDNVPWSTFETAIGNCSITTCYVSLGPPISITSAITETVTSGGIDFTRWFTVDATADVIYIVSNARWTDFGGEHTTTAETFFAPWRE